MRRSLKIAVGSAAVLAAGAAFLCVRTGRLPTLPTPPGVVVPAGMRYVGGDEFDGPLDLEKWKIRTESPRHSPEDPASGVSRSDEVFAQNGVLVISPDGTRRDRIIVVTHKTRPPGNRDGCIEIRARFVPPIRPEGQTIAGSGVEDDIGAMARFQYDRTPDLKGIDTALTDGKAAAFHVYRIEWRQSLFRRFRDDVELPPDESTMVSERFTTEPLTSGLPDWLDPVTPESVSEFLGQPVNAF